MAFQKNRANVGFGVWFSPPGPNAADPAGMYGWQVWIHFWRTMKAYPIPFLKEILDAPEAR